MKRLYVVALVVGLVGLVAPSLVSGQSAAVARPTVGSDGATLFKSMCAGCHGEAGAGAIGPRVRGAGLTVRDVIATTALGRAGTIMPSFNSKLSQAQLAAIAAYLTLPGSLPSKHELSVAGVPLLGTASDGRAVFFGNRAYRCAGCHALGGVGQSVGPDLADRVVRLTPQQLLHRIIHVSDRTPEAAYRPIQVETRGGRLITGILASDTGERLRVYDTSVLPPALIELPKKDVKLLRARTESVMPHDYASRLSLQELVDVVAFLKTKTSD